MMDVYMTFLFAVIFTMITIGIVAGVAACLFGLWLAFRDQFDL